MSVPSTSSNTSPSTAAIALATGIVCAAAGYFLGQGSSLGLFSSSTSSDFKKSKSSPKKSWPNSYDVTIHPDSSDEEFMESLNRDTREKERELGEDDDSEEEEDEEEEKQGGELSNFPENKEECKLVLVVRTDLGMGKGKIAAQCSHATLACYTYFLSYAPSSPLLRRWTSLGQAKVALQCRSEEELLTLQAQALSLGLCARIIHDAGRTQIAAGSMTVLGIGPGPKGVVDRVTGGLKLL
ncbi:hypothetical protein MMC14_006117 [Varicellaria rhodocarpa]|nr:hypothetical protein [Varicellaria rhodocarpa]